MPAAEAEESRSARSRVDSTWQRPSNSTRHDFLCANTFLWLKLHWIILARTNTLVMLFLFEFDIFIANLLLRSQFSFIFRFYFSIVLSKSEFGEFFSPGKMLILSIFMKRFFIIIHPVACSIFSFSLDKGQKLNDRTSKRNKNCTGLERDEEKANFVSIWIGTLQSWIIVYGCSTRVCWIHKQDEAISSNRSIRDGSATWQRDCVEILMRERC